MLRLKYLLHQKNVEEGHLRRQPSKTSKDTWQTIKALYSASQGQYKALIIGMDSTIATK